MATLNELTGATPAAPELLHPCSHWRLSQSLDLFSSPLGPGLATQAWTGRELQLLDEPSSCGRRQVELAEDGYRAWIEPQDLLGRAWSCGPHQPNLLSAKAIQQRLPAVLRFCQAAAEQSNTYLWGGSLGPDYDCSGLMHGRLPAPESGFLVMPINRSVSASRWPSVLIKPNSYGLPI